MRVGGGPAQRICSTERTPPGAGSASATNEQGRLYRLLRNSHIFSAAVREILETRYLEQASDLGLTVDRPAELDYVLFHAGGSIEKFAHGPTISAPGPLIRLGTGHAPGRGDSFRVVTAAHKIAFIGSHSVRKTNAVHSFAGAVGRSALRQRGQCAVPSRAKSSAR